MNKKDLTDIDKLNLLRKKRIEFLEKNPQYADRQRKEHGSAEKFYEAYLNEMSFQLKKNNETLNNANKRLLNRLWSLYNGKTTR